jgi:hypothetical protein
MALKVLKEPLYDLTNHPEHATALGMITAAWALVEYELCMMLALVMRAPPWMAHKAYYAIVNNMARIDMIRACSKEMVGDKKYKKRLTELLEKTKTIAGARNGYAHKLWLIENGNVYAAEQLSQIFPMGTKRKIQPKEMFECADRITNHADELAKFVIDYSHENPIILPDHLTHPSLQKKS